MASRAGNRVHKYKLGLGRVNKNRVAMLRTTPTKQVSLNAYKPEEFDQENDVSLQSEEGVNYLLLMQIPGRERPLSWNLSSMTAEELELTRRFFNHAFDLADPVARERDRVANHAFSQGDGSYERSYRIPPQFLTREGSIEGNSEGVLLRPASPVEGSGNELDPDGRVRGDGDELVDSQSEHGGSHDDEPQAE